MKGTCLSIYSRTVNAEAPLGELLESAFPWCAEWEAELRCLFAAYAEAKQKQNVLDYDDLLLYWAQMMSEASFAEDLSARFDHVLVDEYQDTNRLQPSILRALKPDGKGLTVVGDDAQSIYSFRAATVRNILDFPEEFSPKAEVITLERNYRSTQPILSAACKRKCGGCGRKYPLETTGFTKAAGSVDRVGGILLTPPALTQCHAGTIAPGRPALPRMVPRAL